MKITDSIQYVQRFFEAKQRFGSLMLHFKKGCPIFFEFVFGEKHRTPLDLEQFTAEVENIYQDLHVRHTEIDNNFSCILVTVLYECRKCNKTLQIKGDYKKVTIYDYAKGTSTGIRFTKFCRQCSIYEHAGYYVQDGYRLLDLENFEKYDILLSTEDTAFTKRTLKTFSWELVIGHMAFMTKAEIYNKSFSYKIPSHKRKRKIEHHKKILDRRRLEDGFILFAVAEVSIQYGIQLNTCIIDRKQLLEEFNELFYQKFIQKWKGHQCEEKGCGTVIVLDGNMKNCRQICNVKDVTRFVFDSLDSAAITGCLNSPKYGSRFCEEHDGTSIKFVDEGTLSVFSKEDSVDNRNNEEYSITNIIERKETRSTEFSKVIWSNGQTTWVKSSDLPRQFKGNSTNIKVDYIPKNVFGQKNIVQRLTVTGENNHLEENYQQLQKNIIPDNNGDDIKSQLRCNTEKSKQLAKNRKTAGILVIANPCGIALDIKELYNSESKSQVYGYLHDFIANTSSLKTDVICYDDACHLKKYSSNPIRKSQTETARILGDMEYVVDKFHFKNHVDTWCKKHCNPYKCDKIKDVNTEVCEQLFSWLSKFNVITKHMNRQSFNFLMLFVLDQRNWMKNDRDEI